jgi:NitT/TauT family transport system substrate-binding protein
MNRRTFGKSGLAAGLATGFGMPFLSRAALAQEVSGITLVMQHGLPYLPLMVMQAQKLVEKHAAKVGLPSLAPDYKQLGGTSSLVDALISGQMHFGIIGAPAVITLWDKTAGTQNEVRALCAVQSMPFVLVTNNPAVKSFRDFTDKDKIALPSVKVSAQAVCLQMACAKEWGQDQFAKLDSLTITRSHPDAAAAIIGGGSEITGHYAVAPFYYQELAAKGVTVALRSYDTLGGPATNGALVMSKKFGDANPKVTAAVYAAMTEANAFVNANPKDAASIYVAAVNEKKSTPDELAKMIADPDNVWTTAPQNTMKYMEFMNKVGTVKRMATSWKDFTMPNAHELAGS